MYNKQANDIWLNRVRRFVRNKRIIVVGNATSILTEKQGDFIDSFDVVMRFGRGFPTDLVSEYIGTRTDIWTFGVLRAGCYKQFKDARFKIFNLIQRPLYQNSWDMSFPRCALSEEFQVYKDWFLNGSEQETKAIIGRAYRKEFLDTKMRMSQGVFMLLWLIEAIRTYESIDIIGFDCMKSVVKFDTDERDNRYASSWHMPVAKVEGPDGNPHTSSDDERVLLKLEEKNLINWHRTDHTNLNLELLAEISKTLRPDMKNLEGLSNETT